MFKSLFNRIAMAAVMAAFAIMMITATAGAASAVQLNRPNSGTRYTFTTLYNNNDPTFNQLPGINNHGVIAGYFGSGTVVNGTLHPNKGYTLSRPYRQGNYTNENFPGSVQTQVTAINNHGNTAGFWVDGNGNSFGFIEWNGVFTSYMDPNTGAGTVNQLLGLNDKGKTFSEFDFPNSTNTTPLGINNSDQIVGSYVDGAGKMHGFVLSHPLKHARWQTIDDPNGVGTTTINGINDKAQLVGFYVDGAGNTDGFLAVRK